MLILFFFIPFPPRLSQGSAPLLPSANPEGSPSQFRSSDNGLQFLPGRLMLIMQCANGRIISHNASFPPAHPFQNFHFIIHICFGIERFRMRFQVTLGKNHTGTMQNYVFCRNRYINTLFRSSRRCTCFQSRGLFFSPLLKRSRIGCVLRFTFARFFLTESSVHPFRLLGF